MNKILLLLLVGILIFNGFGATAITRETKAFKYQTKEISVSFSEPIIRETDQYIIIDFNEATSSISDVGKPILPVVTQIFTFPFGSKLVDVEVHFSNVKKISLSKEIQSTSKSSPINTISQESRKNKEIYEYADLYPSDSYKITTGGGIKDDKHVIYLAVHCYPIRYSYIEKSVYYSVGVDIKVNYEEPIIPVLFNDEYDMVIVAPNKFSSALQPLIQHKKNNGVQTIFKTIEDIYKEYNGRDEAEQIKYFIKDAIEKWNIKYVLLVGSIDIIPIRKTAVCIWGDPYWDNELPTDLYYADIFDADSGFCSWDSNNNNQFGEYNSYEGAIDFVDLYPDVNIGRLLCTNKWEVKTVINKIIKYETETYGKNWFNNLLLMGGDTVPNNDIYEGEIVNEQVAQIMPGFNHIKLWTSTNSFNPSLINQNINAGVGFVCYAGHGFEYGIGTHPPKNENFTNYNKFHLYGLTNHFKLPIVFFDCCSVSKLDFVLDDLFNNEPFKNFRIFTLLPKIVKDIKLPCFAWCMVKKPLGGAIATIGATRVSFGFVNNSGAQYGVSYLDVCFFKAYESGIMVSEMLTKAQNDYLNNIGRDYVTLEMFILLGDPSLRVGGYP
jgi:hypothetical protein